MKHYRAKPLAQLSKYLQDDIKNAVMKLELELVTTRMFIVCERDYTMRAQFASWTITC